MRKLLLAVTALSLLLVAAKPVPNEPPIRHSGVGNQFVTIDVGFGAAFTQPLDRIPSSERFHSIYCAVSKPVTGIVDMDIRLIAVREDGFEIANNLLVYEDSNKFGKEILPLMVRGVDGSQVGDSFAFVAPIDPSNEFRIEAEVIPDFLTPQDTGELVCQIFFGFPR